MMNTTHRFGLAFVVVIAACGSPGKRPDAGGGKMDGQPPVADASMFGTPCNTSADCMNSGYCVAGPAGNVCTYSCNSGCPTGWNCRVDKVDGSLISVCVPPQYDLCTPCAVDATCNGGVCITLGGASSCLPSCALETSCPSGYTCKADPTGAHMGVFCIPNTMACTCAGAADDGQVRTCQNTNATGTCNGLQTCHPSMGGWSACMGPTASAETCNGLDDDCDGLVDEGTGGGACTNTNANGTCPGVYLCTGAGGLVCQGQTAMPEVCNYRDDDCDGIVDEGFTGLGTACSAGSGACLRQGVIECKPDGSGTQCSAAAGAPVAETCNYIDDDCDGLVDEDEPSAASPGFPTDNSRANLGTACSVSTGQCARQGTYVCTANGAGTQCSATAGAMSAEICDGLDNDCDGLIDEDFKDPATGLYNQNTHCGSCATDCTVQYSLPNAYGTCVETAGPPATVACKENCNTGCFNLDNNPALGCPFCLDAAIYVSINDPHAVDDAGCGLGPYGTGAGNYPCLTIAHGMTRATATTRTKVLVANGTYNEAVTITAGISLYGGYRADDWTRDVASTDTVIDGTQLVNGSLRTIQAINITTATTFEGFVVYGGVSALPGGNSYAIYTNGSNASLTIDKNVIFGGAGGPGTNGTNGVDGVAGGNGTGRSADLTVTDANFDAEFCPTTTSTRNGGAAGTNTCGGTSVAGGIGGGNTCPASASDQCTCGGPHKIGTFIYWDPCSTCQFWTGTETPLAGNGLNGGAAGGSIGYDMISSPVTLSGGSFVYLCYLPPSFPSGTAGNEASRTYGLDGAKGAAGSNGSSGAGCSVPGGNVSGGEWKSGGATAGIDGTNGGGGGGGGAGGGSKCLNFGAGNSQCQSGKDALGGAGGGGGAGGCGGTGGTQATSGGGAFDIFVVGAAIPGPTITGNTLSLGQGGLGGNGGGAGKGGSGGTGGAGGITGVPSTFCSDVAGRGGDGGAGGNGAGGGGGCGGSTFGIYTSGLSAVPNYNQAAAGNTVSGGGAGAGGAGGYSLVNAGGSGSTGLVTGYSFN